MSNPIIIKANPSWLRFDFSELIHFRWVFFMLMVRDIKLRYKQTCLGIAWVIFQPLLTAGIFTLIFARIMHLTGDGIPYVLFAFCGLIPWVVFSGSLQRGSNSLINDAQLITKVYFPRIFIPLSAIFGLIIDYLISIAMMLALMFFKGVTPSIHLWFLPIATLLLFLFASGVNLLLASVNVYYRDFKHIVPFMVQLWMYASPIAYSANLIPEKYQALYYLNPLSGIIDIFRWTFLGMGNFPVYSFSVALGASLLLFFVGVFFFEKLKRNFADII
ncbi:MAG: Teichoic acid translocation permease protein TagG [Chlamydiae bacterium]|nr:Teichoic acid translocation permease protein TagG [Chlamydiota bacterium]